MTDEIAMWDAEAPAFDEPADHGDRLMERLGMHHTLTEVREWDDPIPGWEHGEVVYELTRSAP
jgi:hypothetical protein